MSYLKPESGGFVLYDAFDKPRKLIELENRAANQSDLIQGLLLQEINSNLPKLFDNSPAAAINAIIFLRIVSNLLRKPQIHSALHIGAWSSLDEALAEILPLFNEKNSLYCFVSHRPVGKFAHVNFVYAEVDWGGVLGLFAERQIRHDNFSRICLTAD